MINCGVSNMALEKKIGIAPYSYFDYKPHDIENQYFQPGETTLMKNKVKNKRFMILIRWCLGCIMLLLCSVPVYALTEFSSNAQALTWIFLFGFWFVLIYMLFSLRGLEGGRVMVFAFLQFLFGFVIALNFWRFSKFIGAGVLATALVIFIGMGRQK